MWIKREKERSREKERIQNWKKVKILRNESREKKNERDG